MSAKMPKKSNGPRGPYSQKLSQATGIIEKLREQMAEISESLGELLRLMQALQPVMAPVDSLVSIGGLPSRTAEEAMIDVASPPVESDMETFSFPTEAGESEEEEVLVI